MIMRKFEILQELLKCGHRHMKQANVVGKMAPIDLLKMQGCHRPSICKKHSIHKAISEVQ